MIMISGTQGEPMSSLSRAALDNHKHAKIEPGDTVIPSSPIIPGNEKAIYRVIDHLFRRDAKVFYEDGSKPPLHVSGHASQEELKLLINLVRPIFRSDLRRVSAAQAVAALAASMPGAVGKIFLLQCVKFWN